MKPYSNLKYYRHNKGKLALLAIPLLMGVALLYAIHMVIASYYAVQYNAFVETRKYYTSVQARGSLIREETVASVRDFEDTRKVVPCVLGYTEIDGLISTVGVRVYLLYGDDLTELMDAMGLTLAAGRLPEPGEREIALHEDVLKNKSLAIGDAIGSDISPGETLTGLYRIVGALKGRALAGFAPLETWCAEHGVDRPEAYGILAYAREGRLDALNRYLSYLPLTGNDLSSFESSAASLSKSSRSVYLLLNVIYASVLAIVSLCLGFLTYLFYRGRLREFAILHVIGYSRQEIMLRHIADVLVINAASALAGMGTAALAGAALNAAYFSALGTPLLLADGKTIILSLCAPMLCVLSQTLSIGLSFRGADAVGIIELTSGGSL